MLFQAKASQEAAAEAVERLKHVENAYEKQEQEVNIMTSIIVDHMNVVGLFSQADIHTSITSMNTLAAVMEFPHRDSLITFLIKSLYIIAQFP